VDEAAVKGCVDARAAWLAGPHSGVQESSLYARYDASWWALPGPERKLAARLLGFLDGLPGCED
jgi:hypothetical protein